MQKRKISPNALSYLFIAALLTALLSFAQSIYDFLRFWLQGNFSYDGMYFTAIGNGILNGQRLYVDMLDEKTPMIFHLYAFSLKFAGNLNLLSVLSILAFIATNSIPAYHVFKTTYAKAKASLPTAIASSLACLLFTLSLSKFIAFSSVQGVPEQYGTAFCVLYIWVLLSWRKVDYQFKWKYVLPSALFIFLCVMMKEPFLIVCLSVLALFMRWNKKAILTHLTTYVFAGLFSLVFLALTGCLASYFTIYIPYVMTNRLSMSFTTLNILPGFLRIKERFGEFSPYYPFAIVGIYITYAAALVMENKKTMGKVLSIVAAATLLYISAFTIAIGDFYHQHYIFPLSIFIAIFIAIMTIGNSPNLRKICAFCLSILAIFMVMKTKPHQTFGLERHIIEGMQTRAEYVDTILGQKDINEYLYISPGNINSTFYQFTKAKMKGPIVFQMHRQFTDYDSKYAVAFRGAIDEADAIFIEEDNMQIVTCTEYLYNALEKDFSLVDYESFGLDVPRGMDAKLYLRIKS